MNRQIQIVSNGQELARKAAMEFVRLATDPGRGEGVFTTALSGGSTPKLLYSLLAGDETMRKAVPWERVHFFWGDERHVPPDHPESNYRMAHEALLSKIPSLPQMCIASKVRIPMRIRQRQDMNRRYASFFSCRRRDSRDSIWSFSAWDPTAIQHHSSRGQKH